MYAEMRFKVQKGGVLETPPQQLHRLSNLRPGISSKGLLVGQNPSVNAFVRELRFKRL